MLAALWADIELENELCYINDNKILNQCKLICCQTRNWFKHSFRFPGVIWENYIPCLEIEIINSSYKKINFNYYY